MVWFGGPIRSKPLGVSSLTNTEIPSYQDRLAKAAGIYQTGFVDVQADIIATEHDDTQPVIRRNVGNIVPQSAYLAGLHFGDELTTPVGEFSQTVAELLGGALVYDASNLHATVSDLRLREGVTLPDYDADYAAVMGDLGTAVQQATWATPNDAGLYIDFGTAVTNGETIVIPGTPSPQLDELGCRIVTEAAKLGLKLKLPWGYHLTVSRFTADLRRDSEAVRDLLGLLQLQAPLGRYRPAYVGTSYFNTNPTEGFVLNSVTIIDL